MAKVNIEEENPLKVRFSIQQLPWVLMFRNGIMYKYEGPMGFSGAEGKGLRDESRMNRYSIINSFTYLLKMNLVCFYFILCERFLGMIWSFFFRNHEVFLEREREGLSWRKQYYRAE